MVCGRNQKARSNLYIIFDQINKFYYIILKVQDITDFKLNAYMWTVPLESVRHPLSVVKFLNIFSQN